MKKRIVTIFLAFMIAVAGLLPVTSAVFSEQTMAATAAPTIVCISKTTAKNYIPSNAWSVRNGKYYLDTRKLDKIAKKVATKGKIKSVKYRFKDTDTDTSYTVSCTSPNGTLAGILNAKGWMGDRYFSTKNGMMYKGLKQVDGEYYYFNKTTGLKQSDCTIKIDGLWHYFDSEGKQYKVK